MIIFTVGHSTHTEDAFVSLLWSFKIQRLIDIRTIPKSRFNPQFNQDSLKDFLEKHNIGYVYMKELGGLRHARPDSINTGWENESFRGYADYMQTDEFAASIAELILLAGEKISAVMCAEAVPWKCHRWLLADSLIIRGIEVRHIMNESTSKLHVLNPMAKVEGKHIIYPPRQGDLF